MSELLRFDLDDGTSVLVEVADDEPGVVRAARSGEVVQAATGAFEAGLDGVREAASAALRRLRDVAEPPDEVSLEFGVRLNAEAGAVIAKAGVEGHLHVTLTWRRPSGD